MIRIIILSSLLLPLFVNSSHIRVCVNEEAVFTCHNFKISQSANDLVVNIPTPENRVEFGNVSTVTDIVDNLSRSIWKEAFMPIISTKPLLKYIYKLIRYNQHLSDVFNTLCRSSTFLLDSEKVFLSLIGEASIAKLNLFIGELKCDFESIIRNSITKATITPHEIKQRLITKGSLTADEQSVLNIFKNRSILNLKAPYVSDLVHESIFERLTECFQYYALPMPWSFQEMKQKFINAEDELGRILYNCLHVIPYSNSSHVDSFSQESVHCVIDKSRRSKRSPEDPVISKLSHIIESAIMHMKNKKWSDLRLERDNIFLKDIKSAVSQLPIVYQQGFLSFFRARLFILKNVLKHVSLVKTVDSRELHCVAKNKHCTIMANDLRLFLAGISYIQGGVSLVPKIRGLIPEDLVYLFKDIIRKRGLPEKVLFSLFTRFYPHENLPITYLIYKRLETDHRFFLYSLLQDPFVIIALLETLF